MIKKSSIKRGDTIIEVMFAIAIFALVAILSIAMMNAGIASGERSLELVTARNELNAQAEAIRFIHRSYVSEKTLPKCDDPDVMESNGVKKCQEYEALWNRIVEGAISAEQYTNPETGIPYPLNTCQQVYDHKETLNGNLLQYNKAFVINVRKLNEAVEISGSNDVLNSIYVSAQNKNDSGKSLFQPAPLNARIVYSNSDGDEEDGAFTNVSTTNPLNYTNISQVDGMWVVVVKDDNPEDSSSPRYYDFYIETCWYGSNSSAPTSLDAVIRLYNPENMK